MDGKARVLVAEDDADMRALVADALRREGHDVVELTSGADLLVYIARTYRVDEKARTTVPDLIVSDVRMPVMNGLDVLRGIREAHWTAPVLLMTAFGDSETRRIAEALDAVMIDKPLRLATLCAEVRRMLDVERRRARRPE